MVDSPAPQEGTTPEMAFEVERMFRGAMENQLLLYRRVVNRARLRVASWLFGEGWWAAVTRLQVMHQRAKLAITPDGQVVLSECAALAEILYGNVPGEWKFTAELVVATSENSNDAPMRPNVEGVNPSQNSPDGGN